MDQSNDENLPLPTQKLLGDLDNIAEQALYAADVRPLLQAFAASFAAYLRTPD